MPSNNKTTRSHRSWPVPMEVKRNRIEGRGLFTKVPLRARQRIGEFTGERISQHKGRRRAKTQKWIAILELNHKRGIDAAKKTAGFRFVNHCCSPNTFMRIIVERAAFYALHGTRAGTELTVDCHPSHHNGTLPCKYGSAVCRGIL